MEYTTISSSWIYGAVASYPFAGYLRVMPLVPWETFYWQMRILMDDFVVHEEDDCRALIISTNFVYPFVSYVVTVDVIIEFHESGTGEAHTHVQGIKITSEKFIERTILYCTSAYFIVQIIASMYRTGVRGYFDRAPKVLGIIGLGNYAICTMWYALRVQQKYAVINKLYNTPLNKYTDLHSPYNYELIDSSLLLFCEVVYVQLWSVHVFDVLGSEWLRKSYRSTFKVGLVRFVL
ncbi:hypothetical protein GE061_010991 [Apolygus lucorum]|uniref:Uncharacterized protein n=1 Tax=Apolygus lucorum TaxID=248454 RepID=A0A8S9XWG9_APOLU|nr:hypothetical protein GE061_010991 [Apolygus lucorum]